MALVLFANTFQAQWEAEMAAGEMDSAQYPELGYTKCENGFAAAIPGDANNTFRCNNVRSSLRSRT